MKRCFELAFVILFPYFVIFALVCMFNDSLMSSVFNNNGLFLLFALLVLYIIAMFSSVVVLIMNLFKKRNAQEILKINMIIKLIHVPAYIVIFIMGLMCTITIFTLAISILLFILDSMTIVLTGLIGVGGIIRGSVEKKLTITTAILHAILQFIFCLDIISSINIYVKVKKQPEAFHGGEALQGN